RGGDAQWMGRVDAEDLELARKESELLKRQCQWAVLWMRFDVGVELRRGERAADHVAFELGHVDAVGGEPAHRLVERRRHVADSEQKGRHRRGAARRPFGLA